MARRLGGRFSAPSVRLWDSPPAPGHSTGRPDQLFSISAFKTSWLNDRFANSCLLNRAEPRDQKDVPAETAEVDLARGRELRVPVAVDANRAQRLPPGHAQAQAQRLDRIAVRDGDLGAYLASVQARHQRIAYWP